MYINVTGLGGFNEFQSVVVKQQNTQFNNVKTNEQSSGQGHGRGGEYTYTHCNGVGNINSPCQGKPTTDVPEPGTALLLATTLFAVAALRKLRTTNG